MFKKTGLLLFAATAISILAAPLYAEEPKGFTVSPMIGKTYFDDAVADGMHWSLGIGYQFDNPWAIEAVYSDLSTDVENMAVDVDFSRWHVDALYHFATDRQLRPYVAVGAGQSDFDLKPGISDKEVLGNIAVGFKYALAGNTSLRGEVKMFGGSGDVDANSAFSVGIHHAFGKPAAPRDADGDGVPDSRDRCLGTGPGIGVDGDGCPRDDDGDGVLNADDKCPTTPAGVKVDSRGCRADSDRDGVPDSADRCPRTPAGADVDRNGCPRDDDNDGVANYMDKCPNTTRPNAKIDAKGCYVVLTEQVTVELNVQFDNNSSAARPDHSTAVRRVFTFMQQYPMTSVTIEGHTDSRGSAEYNRDLSQRRADTIANLLVNDFGIARSRVKAIGYGETRPLGTNDTAEGRQANRRVVGVVKATVQR